MQYGSSSGNIGWYTPQGQSILYNYSKIHFVADENMSSIVGSKYYKSFDVGILADRINKTVHLNLLTNHGGGMQMHYIGLRSADTVSLKTLCQSKYYPPRDGRNIYTK